MPVHLSPPQAQDLLPVAGVTLGTAGVAIRKPARQDMLVVHLAEGSRVAGVFTRNRFCAAPVTVCREHLKAGQGIRALVVNTGVANAGTGARGLADARTTCQKLAELLNIQPEQVLPFSTGVILEHLPMDRLLGGLPLCVHDLQPDHWFVATQAIMTTDTINKGRSARIALSGHTVTITGTAKGAGMIHPNMATMLGFIATDARISQELLERLTRDIADHTFNCVTVDGDTSTNDSFVIMATGQSPMPEITEHDSADYRTLYQAMLEVARHLAQALARDGEGATKFITVRVEGGRDIEECRKIGFAVAHSPLVKTALFASDPNLGRILAAIGYAGVDDLDVNSLQLYLGTVLVAEHGGRAASYREELGAAVTQQEDILIRVLLHRGAASVEVWTCDFSYDYVKINADYRS